MPHSSTPWFEYFFLPSDGTLGYKSEKEFRKYSASTPIPYHNFPNELFPQWTVRGFDPPILWCGWRIGRKGLLELIEQRYKDTIVIHKHCDDGTIVIDEDATLLKLPKLVEEEFKVEVKFVKVGDERVDDEWQDLALVVADNHKSYPVQEEIDVIKEGLFKAEEPQWYIDVNKFYWSRRKASASSINYVEGNLDELKETHQKVRSECIMAAQVASTI